MPTASPQIFPESSQDSAITREWRSIIAPAGENLRKLAGTTESEFLQIGSRMMDFHQRSSEITTLANQLAEMVSGNQVQSLIDHLRQMMANMQAYLANARSQSVDSCRTLERIQELLEQVTHPLEGFQKMTKALRMLGISTKIESSRLGELGTGFLTLALDVEKLSQLVSEKSSNILGHRQHLKTMISNNLQLVHASETALDKELGNALASTSGSLEGLIGVNASCASFGSLISAVSSEVSANISEVVSSMQMHDMTRQQVEHIIEALDHLQVKLLNQDKLPPDPESRRKLIIEAGDVCELQSAMLRFASSELCAAVKTIVENLRDVAGKQAMMAAESMATTGSADLGEESFMAAMRRGMGTVTSVLVKCSRADQEMSATLLRVAETMQEVSGFVTDIEDIGSEIDLIALNSQIKAAHTGREGAALGVLAEAIKRLSVEAVTQTEAVSQTLLQINQSTAHLFQESRKESEQLGSQVTVMESELSGILNNLGNINERLRDTLSGLNSRVSSLTGDIDQVTAGIDVQERVARMSEEVMAGLDRIVTRARELEPASMEFKDNLRHMEERYTMQSERHIHDAIARKRSGGSAAAATAVSSEKPAGSSEESEFGDNVDLF